MAQASIPVDLFNPGQVFACMGFLEAANVLLGGAQGGFDWTNRSEVRFNLCADGGRNPFEAILEFLVGAEVKRLVPRGYTDPPSTKSQGNKRKRKQSDTDEANASDAQKSVPMHEVQAFPAAQADRLALPLRFERDGQFLDVSHWCDGSSRKPFKLFAGQQRSDAIAREMLDAVRKLREKRQNEFVNDPLNLLVPLGGSSFKFDARKAWTAINAGYSPDDQGQAVEASPVVEVLAAVGLEHARPDEFDTREVRYGVWQGLLPPMLARAALGGAHVGVPLRVFRFRLALAGKNKNVTFAQEEITYD